jgi:uncharacterized protein YndB with AHSA1/START domain
MAVFLVMAAPDSDSWSTEIDAAPERVWDLISDPTRTPEWSPVCHRVEWVGDVRSPNVGARFRGDNKLNGARWSRECRITEAEEPRSFAWSTFVNGRESTRWRYDLTPSGEAATHLTESYEVRYVPRWLCLLWMVPGARAKSDRDRDWNVRTSLERLKALAETSTPRV